jgi:hypothetical protein
MQISLFPNVNVVVSAAAAAVAGVILLQLKVFYTLDVLDTSISSKHCRCRSITPPPPPPSLFPLSPPLGVMAAAAAAVVGDGKEGGTWEMRGGGSCMTQQSTYEEE